MKRFLTAVLVTGLLTPAVSAHAAKTPPVCNELTDPKGDVSYDDQQPTTGLQPSSGLDIRSLAVATGRKTVVARLTLTTTDTSGDPTARAGYDYIAETLVEGYGIQFVHAFHAARADLSVPPPVPPVTLSETDDSVSYREPGAGPTSYTAVSGVHVKVTKTTITWTVPRKNLPPLQDPGPTLTGFYASATTSVASDYAPDDRTRSAAVYVDKERSCLHAK